MTTPVVSIIVPAYNYASYLGECLDSVLAQTMKSWECIVIDNGSTDNTSDIVKAYSEKDSRIKYHFTNQKGVSLARNYAVSLSQGEYILPLDADDKIENSYISKALSIMEKHPEISLVYCDAFLFGSVQKKWILPEFNYKNLLIENSIFCSAMYRKTDFDLVKGYNINMVDGFEDWDFWIKLLKNDKKVIKINEPLFYYRIKENSRNSILDENKQLKLRTQIYNNHIELYNSFFTFPELVYANYQLKQKYDSVSNSLTYKIGKLLVYPLNLLKRLLK